MKRIVACINVSLDGVMQAPARPDEDRRGGFDRGGWATPYAAMTEAGHVFGSADALLFGRRTYEDFFAVWPARNDPRFTPYLTTKTKYVVSRTLSEPLPWATSILLHDLNAIRDLGGNLLILGSGELIRSMIRASLVPEFVLLIHPLLLGRGQTLFGDDGSSAQLELVETKTTPRGVIIATYRPAA